MTAQSFPEDHPPFLPLIGGGVQRPELQTGQPFNRLREGVMPRVTVADELTGMRYAASLDIYTAPIHIRDDAYLAWRVATGRDMLPYPYGEPTYGPQTG